MESEAMLLAVHVANPNPIMRFCTTLLHPRFHHFLTMGLGLGLLKNLSELVGATPGTGNHAFASMHSGSNWAVTVSVSYVRPQELTSSLSLSIYVYITIHIIIHKAHT